MLALPEDLRPFYPGCPWGTPGTGATSGGRELVSVIVGRGGRRGGDTAFGFRGAGFSVTTTPNRGMLIETGRSQIASF